MENVLVYKWKKGVAEIFPANKMVSFCMFNESTKEEAVLLNQIAIVAEKNGLNSNDIVHLFPPILRMLKSKINWSE